MNPGKINGNVLKRSVLRPIKDNQDNLLCGAGTGVDCAVFSSFSGSFSCICSKEGSIHFISIRNLIYKAANNIAAAGGICRLININLLLPGELEEPFLAEVMKEASTAAKTIGAGIAECESRVTQAVTEPFAVVTAFGEVNYDLSRTKAKAGMDIVLSKWIGLYGTAYLAGRYEDELKAVLPNSLIEKALSFEDDFLCTAEAAIAEKSGVRIMHDASEGGILASLWELAEREDVGLKIDLRKLPIRQESIEVCEALSKNPYELMSNGCMIFVCENGEKLATALKESGINGTVIGEISADKKRIILNEGEIRYMDRPHTDEIYSEKENKNER